MSEGLFLVTGASGKLGQAFIQELQKQKVKIIALSRKETRIDSTETHKADLLNEKEISLALDGIDFSDHGSVYLIHAVGKFKFEKDVSEIVDTDGDGIDDEVYETNVITLKNVLKGLLDHRSGVAKVKICAFASVSDKYDIPFWKSYTKAKNIIRGYLKELCETGQVQALVVNVSTVDTGNENVLRPNADKTYWLQPEEIVSATLPELMSLNTYKEIDVIKEKPDFDPKYYIDHEALLKKWKEEM